MMQVTRVLFRTNSVGDTRTYDVRTSSPLRASSNSFSQFQGFYSPPSVVTYKALGNQALDFITQMLSVPGVREVRIEPWRFVLIKTEAFLWHEVEVHLRRILIEVYGYEGVFLERAS